MVFEAIRNQVARMQEIGQLVTEPTGIPAGRYLVAVAEGNIPFPDSFEDISADIVVNLLMFFGDVEGSKYIEQKAALFFGDAYPLTMRANEIVDCKFPPNPESEPDKIVDLIARFGSESSTNQRGVKTLKLSAKIPDATTTLVLTRNPGTDFDLTIRRIQSDKPHQSVRFRGKEHLLSYPEERI